MTKIFLIAGARPNFMKIAPIYRELKKHRARFKPIIVHTGQHYDDRMSRVFFDDLNLPKPDVYLGVGSASHAAQTAKIMIEFEKALIKNRPGLCLVVGDVNSTIACALTAAKLNIPVAHVEAGLRSFDRAMPEEINRILTDRISDYLFTTCEDANKNLLREGVDRKKIFFVGNVMIDTLKKSQVTSRKSQVLKKLGLKRKNYALLTLHWPSNVDDKETFTGIAKALSKIAKQIPIIFSVHPRTRSRINEFNLEDFFAIHDPRSTPVCRSLGEGGNHDPRLSAEVRPRRMKAETVDSGAPAPLRSYLGSTINCVAPLGYLDFLKLMCEAKFVLTDSGGMQEETTVLNIPCLTLRENTERPITITEGTNTLVGTNAKKIIIESKKILNGSGKTGKLPKFWDGRAAGRIVKSL